MSVFSTPASENQTLKTLSSSASGEMTKAAGAPDTSAEDKADESMEIDRDRSQTSAVPDVVDTSLVVDADQTNSALRSTQQRTFIPPGTVIQSENGTIIIEELDTPAIRREKTIRRKEERRRLAAAATQTPAATNAESAVIKTSSAN